MNYKGYLSICILNAFSVAEDPSGKDKTLTRLDLRFVLKDHFTLVQLFKMTEEIFSSTLLAYYFLNVGPRFHDTLLSIISSLTYSLYVC